MTHKMVDKPRILYIPYWLSDTVMKQLPNVNLNGLDLSFMRSLNKEDIYKFVELNRRLLEILVTPEVRLFSDFEEYHNEDIFIEDMEEDYKAHLDKLRATYLKDKTDGDSNENPYYFNITTLGLIDKVVYLPNLNLLLLLDTNDNDGVYINSREAYKGLKALTFDIANILIPYLSYDGVAKLQLFRFYASEVNELGSIFRALGLPE